MSVELLGPKSAALINVPLDQLADVRGGRSLRDEPRECNFSFSASHERIEIQLVENWRRRESCQSITFDEKRLDPHGIGNLPRVFTMKDKSFTFGVRGKVE